MSWLCPHCNKNVVPGHSCKEGFEQSSLSEAIKTELKYCNGCAHLSIDEEEQRATAGFVPHICNALNKTVFHIGQHPNILRDINCPGFEWRVK